MSETVSQASRVAAIYARVSSERQREEGTVASQLAGLRELAAERGLIAVEELVVCDEGFSGATLTRPALERLRDRAAEGAFEVLLCYAPDRLARRYAYQVLLLEELTRAGVEVIFARGGERSGSPEDELLRQFQGMIAEYERAQIRERTRRGKLHRARTDHQAVMAGAPYGYRFVKKTDLTEGYWEIDETEAEVVREIFRRYTEEQVAIAELARWLTDQGIPTRTGKSVWDRSTVWGMLRNPAYRGQAAYGKTKVADRHGKPTRTTRARGERRGRRQIRLDEPIEQWTFIPVPPLVTDEQFELAQERLGRNAHFAKRNTKKPTLLQGILVCRECGYACYRTSTRTTNKRIYYYRCIGSDNYRHIGGRVCHSRPIRADELDQLVWAQVRGLLEDPALVRAEIDRRLKALRTEHPAARRREGLEHDLTRAGGAIERLIEAYADDLVAICATRREAQAALDALRAILGELGLRPKESKTRIVELRQGGEGLVFLGFEHRLAMARTRKGARIEFLARYPAPEVMQRARERVREITARRRLLVPVEQVVQELNLFLRGWSNYFRYGNSNQAFHQLMVHTHDRLGCFVAKRHKRGRVYARWLLAKGLTGRLGLVDLHHGRVIAPRPNKPWRVKPNAVR
jgi:site-specific DNA recombinase